MTDFVFRELRNYKYQLTQDYTIHVDMVYPMAGYRTGGGWVHLSGSLGLLAIRRGYCWDGPSGPTIDTGSFMRGSLVHDALYQLMREYPHMIEHRDYADRLLRELCIEDGMYRWRAAVVYWGVRNFGRSSAIAEGEA